MNSPWKVEYETKWFILGWDSRNRSWGAEKVNNKRREWYFKSVLLHWSSQDPSKRLLLKCFSELSTQSMKGSFICCLPSPFFADCPTLFPPAPDCPQLNVDWAPWCWHPTPCQRSPSGRRLVLSSLYLKTGTVSRNWVKIYSELFTMTLLELGE